MIAPRFLFLSPVASLFKSKSRLEAENAALPHQLTVLQRKVRSHEQRIACSLSCCIVGFRRSSSARSCPAAWCFRVARRMLRTRFSDVTGVELDFCLIFAP
jgi:hypothetical protein